MVSIKLFLFLVFSCSFQYVYSTPFKASDDVSTYLTVTKPSTENEEAFGLNPSDSPLDEDYLTIVTGELSNPESEGVVTTTSSATSCTDNTNYNKEEKRYALAVFFKANWFRASQYCKYHGMELATINSEEEEQMLESALGEIGFDLDEIWTSGTDNDEEGKFFWMSAGTPVTYTKWYQGEPNGKNQENCLVVTRQPEGYFWNDVKCDGEFHFACEYKTNRNDTPAYI